jgi:hypothetical protein
MIEFTNGLDRLLQLLITGQRAANRGNALAPHAELSRASTGLGHRQSPLLKATSRDKRSSLALQLFFCWRICLISESMGHHDSEIMDDRGID